jgi:hypothetical protein
VEFQVGPVIRLTGRGQRHGQRVRHEFCHVRSWSYAGVAELVAAA